MGWVMTGNDGLNEEFSTLTDLARGLDYEVTAGDHVTTYIEDFAENYIDHDTCISVLDWTESDSGEGLVLTAEDVVMWELGFPATRAQFYSYLDELDLRIGRRRAISRIPEADADSADEDVPAAITSAFAELFGMSVDRVVRELGLDWEIIDSGAVGSYSFPLRFLAWQRAAVVGIDDEYLYVFGTVEGEEGTDAEDEVWGVQWSETGESGFEEFVQVLRAECQTEPAARRLKPLPPRPRPAEDAPELENSSTEHGRGSAIRLLGPAGAAFSMLPIPEVAVDDRPASTLLVDIEVLTPDRLVRYLARRVEIRFLEQLADAWMQCASEPYPEQSVPTVEDQRAGLAVAVPSSSDFTVQIEVLVRPSLGSDTPDVDSVSFDVPRSALVDKSHALRGWIA